ncbi:MAG: kdkA [Gammaproteobacteria bacterium]|nr:kdkA [Gammaproteobacteria bacterium]
MVRSYIKKSRDNRNIALVKPFKLVLKGVKEAIYCDKIIRFVPGKRVVAFGKWGNQEIVAKLFYKKSYLERDATGVRVLLRCNVPTPRLLYQGAGTVENKKMEVLLFERITPAENLEFLWQEKKGSCESVDLMNRIITEIATQHVLGIQQMDLHLKNFLVTEKTIYTLDGGGIKKTPPTLDKNFSLKHLALFFSQLGVNTEPLQKELFKTYCKLRGWMFKQAYWDILKKLIARQNKKRRQQYYKKVFRNCTAFTRINTLKKTIVYDRDYQSSLFMDFLHEPEKMFAESSVTFLKAGRTSTVAKIRVNERWLVVKRYNIKNPWHWLRRCLRRTRAANSWWLAHYLRLFGISTAKPVAYIENHFLGLRGTSYFIMEYIAGQNMGEFFSTSPGHSKGTLEIARRILDVFYYLGKLKITHGDLKMTNILLENEKPVLIDLDGMREHKTLLGFKRAFQKEIKRFMRNWEKESTIYKLFMKFLRLSGKG